MTFKSYEAYKLSTLMEKCSQNGLKCEIEAFIERLELALYIQIAQ